MYDASHEWQSLLPRSEHRDEVGRQGIQADYVEPWVPAKAVKHLWPARREPAKLPPLMTPDGDGFMPLSCAAQWIATRGGTHQFDPEDVTVWQEVFSELLAAISSDRVRVTGLRDGERDLVPGQEFAGCQVDYPHTDAPMDVVASQDLYLRSHPYVNEERWRNGIDDALVNRHGTLWKQLMVEKESIRDRWPFDLAPRSKSGLPGRPTSEHLIMRELEQRFESGLMLPTIREEAKALWEWMKLAHVDCPPGTAKTIENQIRTRHRALRSPKYRIAQLRGTYFQTPCCRTSSRIPSGMRSRGWEWRCAETVSASS